MSISNHVPFRSGLNARNPSSMPNRPLRKWRKYRQFGTRTKSERLLALALKKNGIEFQANPPIRLSACIWYTPDFIIRRRLIVEVDGGVHDLDYRKSPDRIRQRTLEKLGYSVYRVRNEKIMSCSQVVIEEILQKYCEVFEGSISQSNPTLSTVGKAKDMIMPPENDPPENDLILSVAIKLKEYGDKWIFDKFTTYLSEIDPDFLVYPCHTERLLLILMGFELTTNDNGNIDFKSFFDFFMCGIDIMSNLYGDLARTYLINSLSISVANFMKNLIFHGGPRVKPGLVIIDSIESLQNHISEFNDNFSSIGVKLEIDDLKSECKLRIERLDPISREKYLWLLNWTKQTTAKNL